MPACQHVLDPLGVHPPGHRRVLQGAGGRGLQHLEAGTAQQLAQLGLGGEVVALGQRRRQRAGGEEGEQAEPAGGAEHPAQLGQHRGLVPGRVEHPETPGRVEGAVRERQRLAGRGDGGQPEQPAAGPGGPAHRLGACRRDARSAAASQRRRAADPGAGSRASGRPAAPPAPRPARPGRSGCRSRGRPPAIAYPGPSSSTASSVQAATTSNSSCQRLGHRAGLAYLGAPPRPSPRPPPARPGPTPVRTGSRRPRPAPRAAPGLGDRGVDAGADRVRRRQHRARSRPGPGARPGKRCSTRAERSSV